MKNDELKCININPCFFGYSYGEEIYPSDILKLNKIYNIDHIDNTSRTSKIYLKEIPDVWFGLMAFDKTICLNCDFRICGR